MRPELDSDVDVKRKDQISLLVLVLGLEIEHPAVETLGVFIALRCISVK